MQQPSSEVLNKYSASEMTEKKQLHRLAPPLVSAQSVTPRMSLVSHSHHSDALTVVSPFFSLSLCGSLSAASFLCHTCSLVGFLAMLRATEVPSILYTAIFSWDFQRRHHLHRNTGEGVHHPSLRTVTFCVLYLEMLLLWFPLGRGWRFPGIQVLS